MRILFVAMAESVHTARWLRQISGEAWDLHLFDLIEGSVSAEIPSVHTYTVHPPPKGLAGRLNWRSDYPFRRGAGLIKTYSPPPLRKWMFPSRVETLANLIRELKPDIIHSLEMQNESYPLLEVKRSLGGYLGAPWIYSSWGSDIYYFRNFAEHREKIRAVLRSCDFHIADSARDVALAVENGFGGESLGVFPVTGSYDVEDMREFMAPGPVSTRRSIAVKGYEHWAGRALTALRALELCASHLRGYVIEIYLSDERVRSASLELSTRSGLDVRIIDKAENAEILKLFGRARIGIALSITDGTPSTMLESMIMGAFPIQSDTISTAEWIMHGENGFLVAPEDPEQIATAIRMALEDDDLVDTAAEINHLAMLRRIDRSILQPQITELYKKVYGSRTANCAPLPSRP